MLNQEIHLGIKRFRRNGFGKECVYSGIARGNDPRHLGMARQHYDRNIWIDAVFICSDHFDEFDSVQDRHIEISDYDIDRKRLE